MEIGTSLRVDKILIVIFCSLLYLQYCNRNSTCNILEETPKFILLHPSDNTDSVVDDDYDRLFDLKNFSFLINPSVCNSHSGGLLLFIVSSNPMNIKYRDVIRRTWGKKSDSTKIVFLMGTPPETVLEDNTTLADQIRQESLLYQDIVQGLFVDSYRNLTYKHVMGLKWVAHHCSAVKYVLKCDDDAIVHSNALVNFLVRDLSPWGARKLILCAVYIDPIVSRNGTKWAVTKEEYEDDFYPRYCYGFGILYSQDVVRQLVSAARSGRFYWIDDVLVTGIFAEQIQVERTDAKTLINFLNQDHVHALKTKGSSHIDRFLVGHTVEGSEDMFKLLENINGA